MLRANIFLRLSIFPLGRGNPVRPSAMLREYKPLAGISEIRSSEFNLNNYALRISTRRPHP